MKQLVMVSAHRLEVNGKHDDQPDGYGQQG